MGEQRSGEKCRVAEQERDGNGRELSSIMVNDKWIMVNRLDGLFTHCESTRVGTYLPCDVR